MVSALKTQFVPRPVAPIVYIGAVIVFGLAAAGASVFGNLPSEHLLSVALLVGLSALAQFASVSLFGPSSISLSFAFTFLGLLWFGPGVAILTVAAAALIHAVYPTRRPWHKVAFNVGSLSLAVGAAGVVYGAAGGSVALASLRSDLFPALVAGAVYFLVNTLAVSGAISLTSGQPFVRAWASNHYGLWVYYLSVVVLAVVAAGTFHPSEYQAYPVIATLLALPWVINRLWVMRAKQLAQAKRHGEQLRLLHQVGLNVNRAGLNLRGIERMEEVLKPVLTTARELVPAKAAAILLHDKGTGDLRLAAESGLDLQINQALEIALGKDDLASLARGSGPLVKTWSPSPAAQGAEVSAVYFPLVAENRTLGAMGLFFKGRPNFSEEDLGLLRTLAEYAAGAESRLLKTEELESSHYRVVMAQESVRKEISVTLHGTVQNKLLMVWHRLEGLADHSQDADDRALARQLRAELMAIQGDLRALSTQLHPSIVRVGLRPALRSLSNRFDQVLPIEVTVDAAIEQFETDGRIPQELRLALYRVAEEALTNIVKHAAATQVGLRAWVEDATVRLSVQDNGKGFPPEKPRSGLGSEIMRDYVLGAGGTLEVRSTPGAGTAVLVSLPLQTGTAASAQGEAELTAAALKAPGALAPVA